jgi:regulator of sigma E protease
MSILIFILVLVVLIVVHEFGHFIVAKWSGMRVDEFGIGYPPRALVLGEKNGTTYTLNWLPFGGFVKIHGEDGLKPSDAEGSPDGVASDATPFRGQAADTHSFSSKNRFLQALVLVAGIAMNLLLAYVLIVGGLMLGTPRSLAPDEVAHARNVELGVMQVFSGTPAAEVGILPGDAIIFAEREGATWSPKSEESFPDFITASGGEELSLSIRRAEERLSFTTAPERLNIPGAPRYALGVEVVTIGEASLSFFHALAEGAKATGNIIVYTAKGLAGFFVGVFTLSVDLSSVAGPIGIAGVVGSASAQGFSYLLSITAIISINLALINLIPIPALDGGRLLFVIIESIIRRPIRASVSQAVNALGFLFLILLMIIVSVNDIFNIIVG